MPNSFNCTNGRRCFQYDTPSLYFDRHKPAPRDLVEDICSIAFSFIVRGTFQKLWYLSASMHKHKLTTVFVIFRVILASIRLVLSAYILGSEYVRQCGKSLMYIKNRTGPKIVPWGTPFRSCWLSELIKQYLNRHFSYHFTF